MVPTKVLISLIFFSFAQAQNISEPVCSDPDFATVNATGSIPLDSLLPFVDSSLVPLHTWMLSTAVKEVITGNETIVRQNFWLTTNPVVEVSNLTYNYSGCVFVLQDFTTSSQSTIKSNEGSCFIGPDCSNAILANINDRAQSLTNNGQDTCRQLLRGLSPVPSACNSWSWGEVASFEPFGTPNLIGEFTPSTCNSSSLNVFNGSADGANIAQLQSRSFPAGNQNQTIYDSYVEAQHPVILTTFRTDSSGNPPLGSQFNTQMVCLSANNVVSGSRVPSTSGAAAPRRVWSMLLVMLVMLVLAWF